MTAHDRRNPDKVYVKVRADHLPDGRILPLMFRAEDGEAVRIDRITDVREAPSLKLGGQGTRYTCLISMGQADGGAVQREVYLFHDRNRWFVEE